MRSRKMPQASKRDLPDQRQLERELSEYIDKKYGNRAKVISPNLNPQASLEGGDDPGGVWARLKFNMLPDELASYLDQYIVRQEEAKSVLSTKICTHFNRARYLSQMGNHDPADGVGLIKNNVLLIGPTGVGKTYMVKLIAAKLGVPFVKGDATKFSETGYVGGDVEDLIRDLVHEADDDIELAQYGIVYVDEVDKIASTRNLVGPDVSRTGVQRALLKPMEETEVDLKVPHDPISQIQAIEKFRKTGKREKRSVNTRHILFIMSGAFKDLVDIIKKRLNQGAVGFKAQMRDSRQDVEYLKMLTAQDLVEFGFETEFVGRIPVVVVLDELSADDLYEILKNPNNPVVISKKRDFAAYGIDLRMEDEALRLLAGEAAQMKTGARALVSVVERALLPFEQHLPGSPIKELLLTPEVVRDPSGQLARLVEDPDNDEMSQRYEAAGRAERMELLKMVAMREHLFRDRLTTPLTPARMDLIADEYYRAGMTLGAAFDNVLDRLDQVRAFEQDFLQRYQIQISFNEPAQVAILASVAAEATSVKIFLHNLSQVLEPGLRLVHDRTGQIKFDLPEQAVLDTESYLRGLFQKHYQQTLTEQVSGRSREERS